MSIAAAGSLLQSPHQDVPSLTGGTAVAADAGEPAATAAEHPDAANASAANSVAANSAVAGTFAAGTFAAGAGAASSGAASYQEDDPDFTLVVFSKLSEARQLLGEDVDTVYFRRTGAYPDYVLEPLKAVRSKDFSLNTADYGRISYEPTGAAAVVFAGTLPTASAFLDMHALEQRALVALLGDPQVADDVTYTALRFEAAGDQPAVTAVLSQDGQKVHIVERMQTRDFAFISRADQTAIAATPGFAAIGGALGLTTDRNEALALVQKEIDAIKAAFPDDATTTTTAIVSDLTDPPINLPSVTLAGVKGFFTLEERDLFLKQLALVKTEIETFMGVFHLGQIGDRAAQIKARFDTALAFGDLPRVKDDGGDVSKTVLYVENNAGIDIWTLQTKKWVGYTNIMSLDGNKTIKEGFDALIAQERILFECAATRQEILKNIMQKRSVIEAPLVIFRLSALDTQQRDAQSAINKEMLHQQNEFAKSLAAAVQALSQNTAVNGSTRYMGAAYNVNDAGWIPPFWSPAETRAIAMFQANNGSPGAIAPVHPLARLRGIEVPHFDFVDASGWAVKQTKEVWQQWSQQLARTTDIVNQETQAVVNRLNAGDRDRNTTIETLSSIVSALKRLIRTIGSGTR